jgi:hypothetical protein
MKGELEYRAVVAVGVDLETGEVESVTVRAATDGDERVDLSISLDSDEDRRTRYTTARSRSSTRVRRSR